MAMHKLLENALTSLSTDNALASWTIYHENTGSITLKNRYNEKPGASSREVDGHYRRKSPRQVNRDRERRRQWHAARHAEGLSQTNAAPQIQENHVADPGSSQTVADQYRRNTTNYVCDKVVEDDVSNAQMTVLSPIATRSRTRALMAHDTPETGRHDCDNDTIPILLENSDTSLQEDNLAESSLIADTRSPISKCAEKHCISPTVLHLTPDVSTSDDPASELDTLSPLTDRESDGTVDNELGTPWEPPPGFCWTCWIDYPWMECPKHLK